MPSGAASPGPLAAHDTTPFCCVNAGRAANLRRALFFCCDAWREESSEFVRDFEGGRKRPARYFVGNARALRSAVASEIRGGTDFIHEATLNDMKKAHEGSYPVRVV